MKKKEIEITESSRRIAKKRVPRLREKFKYLDIWLDGTGSINVCSSRIKNIENQHIMNVYGPYYLLAYRGLSSPCQRDS